MKHFYQLWFITAACLFFNVSQSQINSIKVSGIILDEASREPLAGVSISDKNQTLAITKADGSYSIEVPAGTILTVTSVSYGSTSFRADKSESGKSILLHNDVSELQK